jgi:hypothetical protein
MAFSTQWKTGRGKPYPSSYPMQNRREWADKPDGTIITADAARASTRDMPSARRPGAGVDYYAILQVGGRADLSLMEGR